MTSPKTAGLTSRRQGFLLPTRSVVIFLGPMNNWMYSPARAPNDTNIRWPPHLRAQPARASTASCPANFMHGGLVALLPPHLPPLPCLRKLSSDALNCQSSCSRLPSFPLNTFHQIAVFTLRIPPLPSPLQRPLSIFSGGSWRRQSSLSGPPALTTASMGRIPR